MLSCLHVLFLCGITLYHNIHANGVPFQQIEFKLSPNSTVIGTLSMKIAHHNANFPLSTLRSHYAFPFMWRLLLKLCFRPLHHHIVGSHWVMIATFYHLWIDVVAEECNDHFNENDLLKA